MARSWTSGRSSPCARVNASLMDSRLLAKCGYSLERFSGAWTPTRRGGVSGALALSVFGGLCDTNFYERNTDIQNKRHQLATLFVSKWSIVVRSCSRMLAPNSLHYERLVPSTDYCRQGPTRIASSLLLVGISPPSHATKRMLLLIEDEGLHCMWSLSSRDQCRSVDIGRRTFDEDTVTDITRSALSSPRGRSEFVRRRYSFVEGGRRTVRVGEFRHYHPRGPSFRFMLPTMSSLDRIVGRMHPSHGHGFPMTRESPRPHASSCPPFSPCFSPFSPPSILLFLSLLFLSLLSFCFSPFSSCPFYPSVSLPSLPVPSILLVLSLLFLSLLSFWFSPFSSCPFYPSGSLPSIHSLSSLSPRSSKGWPTPQQREREGVSSLPFVSIVHRRASRGFARAPSSARLLDP
eukprot:scaffold566_cov364-Pavlova_lutheri.AAC.20